MTRTATNSKTDLLVTTYLEMRSAPASRGHTSQVRDQKFEVEERKPRDWRFNREMYFKVGEQWRWIDKRPWSDEQWQEWSRQVRTFAAILDNRLAGYYELREDEEGGVEIAYFGLLPDFVGRGLGGAFLTSAIENAWAWTPTPSRVWVHTCNRDHPNALANYRARGFEIYKVE